MQGFFVLLHPLLLILDSPPFSASVKNLPLSPNPLFLLWFFQSLELLWAALTCLHFSWFPPGSAALTAPRICNRKASALQEGEYRILYDKLQFRKQLWHTHRYQFWILGFFTSMWLYMSCLNYKKTKLQVDNRVVRISYILVLCIQRQAFKWLVRKNSAVFEDNSV